MMSRNRVLLALMFWAPLALALWAAELAAADWPQWRGPARDGISREQGIITAWSQPGPPLVWKVEGGEGFSSISVSQGRLYTMVDRNDQEWVVCLDAGTGLELWKVLSADSYKEYQGGNGARATPTVDGPRVYALGATGTLLCLDKRSGRKIWKREILEEMGAENLIWGVSTSPLVEENMLLVNVGAPGASVVAFDKESGKVIWKALDEVASYSSPIAITVGGIREVVFFGGRAIMGLSPQDGTLHWKHEWRTTSDMNIATPIFASPYLFISSGRGTGSGLLRLTPKGDRVQSRFIWTSEIMQNHYNGCVLVGEYLYGFDNSVLKCMRLTDGEVLWAHRSVGKGSLIAAQGHLIILGEQGHVAMVQATPEGYRQTGVKKILQHRAWTPPALSGGRLYARDHHHIASLDLRKRR